jgi:hypothetical protein
MASGDMANGERHREHRQAERKRDTEQSDSDPGKGRRNNGTAAPAQDQPECPQEFGSQFLLHL